MYAFRFFPAMVLYVAAVLKLHSLTIVNPSNQFEWWQISATLAVGELVLSFFLFTGLQRRLAFLISCFVFSVFALTNAWNHFSGFSDCGCFGVITVPPILSLAISITCLASLGWSRRLTAIALPFASPNCETGSKGNNFRKLARCSCFAILCLLPLVFLVFVPNRTLINNSAGLETRTSPTDVLVLDLEGWRGKSFDFVGVVSDIPEFLSQGTWLVLFYSKHCSACDRVAKELLQRDSLEYTGLFFVSVSGADRRSKESENPKLHYAYFKDPHKYFVETPTTLTLKDGIVVKISQR